MVGPASGHTDLYDAHDVRLSCGAVELRPPDERAIKALVALAVAPDGVLPHTEHHYLTWLDKPADRIAADLTADLRRERALPRHGQWTLSFAIVVNERIVGLQSLAGFELWPRRRNVGTTSWLASWAQSAGYGTRARVAVLDLAFTVLFAQAAMSWVSPDNARSVRISERLGYTLIEGAESSKGENKYQLVASDWNQARPDWVPPTRFDSADALAAWLLPRN